MSEASQSDPPPLEVSTPEQRLQALGTGVQFLPGVGENRAKLLHRMGLRNALDLLFFFPRSYQPLGEMKRVQELEEGKFASLVGEIVEVETKTGRKPVVYALVQQGGEYLRAVWFNQPWMANKLPRGTRVLISGTPRFRLPRWEMSHPRVQSLEPSENPLTDQHLPIYSLTEGLTQTAMRRIFRAAVERYAVVLDEVFPEDFLQRHQLLPIQQAITQIHFPDNTQLLEAARRRFIYQELLVLQLAMAFKRQRNLYYSNAPSLEATTRIDARIKRLFPFELTAGQQQAIAEVAADMARPHPMNRMLQGDVGSGKTVVALYAVLLSVAHGHQAAMMAPTEVLARQHERTLGAFLRKSQVRVALLSGSLSGKQREETLRQIAAGEVDVVIGTQAIVASGAKFHKLGLVVIDEQHKFGVRQRASLKQAGVSPHYLVMTATPIPRTVALSVFGDLEVSSIRDRPPGRQPLHTYFAAEEHRARWWDFVRKKLDEGRQAYVIAPLVEDLENEEAATVEATFENLANGELEAYRLGLLHGRMTPGAKDEVMQRFNAGDVQVLVSTSVVEVGVDVPNATLMAIEGAERFGLAQLHQLRGRITRGKYPGYCTLFGNPQTEESKRRLEAFCKIEDGFELAELDFKLRGSGDFFGVRQSGLPPLRIAELQRDIELVQQARQDAEAILTEDAGLASEKWAKLRKQLLRRYGEALDLGDVA